MTHLSRETLADWRNRPTDALRAQVVPHLAVCRQCAAAYAALLREQPTDAGASLFNPADFTARGLEIGTRALAGSPWSRAWRRVVQFPGSIGRAAFESPAPARWALAVQFAVIVALGGALIVSRSEAPTFTTSSGGTSDVPGARLTIVFEPVATMETVRQTLATVGGSIVSGPSAAGVYVVVLPLPSEAAGVETSIETLRGQTSVVRFVEREP